MKKIVSVLLAVLMVLGVMTATVVSAEVNVTEKGFTVAPGTSNMDWTAVAADENGDFAMLCAYNGGIDSAFEANYQGAKAAGVQVGAYCVMKAATLMAAQEEATGMLKAIAGKQFEYPIYLDVEDPCYEELGVKETTNLIKTACEMLKDAGYCPGIYSPSRFAKNCMEMTELSEYTFWISAMSETSNYTGDYDMWQYTYGGEIAGMEEVNINNCYVDFPQLMRSEGLNGYEKEEIPEPTPDPEPMPDPDPVTDTDVPTPTDVVLGDVNGDEKVDAKDALNVLKYAVQKLDLTEAQQKAAEVDGKEGINAKDALEILKYAVKKIEKFPIEA